MESTFLRHPELVSGSIWPSARVYGRKPQTDRQIMPVAVLALDQVDLPLPVPAFQLLLAQDSVLHVAEQLVANETVDPVAAGEAFDCTIAVLPKPRSQIARDADVKRAVPLASKHVDAGLAILPHGSKDAARWMLKQVQHDEIYD